MADRRHVVLSRWTSDSYKIGGRFVAHTRSIDCRKLAFRPVLEDEFLVVVHRHRIQNNALIMAKAKKPQTSW
jgi:hypothetical protein